MMAPERAKRKSAHFIAPLMCAFFLNPAAFAGQPQHGLTIASSGQAKKDHPEGIGQERSVIQPNNLDEPARIEIMINETWKDATATWKRILGPQYDTSEWAYLSFVRQISASLCYGLYVGGGPVYCTGNNTVFVSVAELIAIEKRSSKMTDAGLAFLVAHEIGHHVQKISGRFRRLSDFIRQNPQARREYLLRYELEADCLAGVWAKSSQTFSTSTNASEKVLSALELFGDESVQFAATGRIDPSTFTHGTSLQRKRWFSEGWQAGHSESCDVLNAKDF